MKKNILLTTFTLGFALFPMFASAQVSVSATTSVQASLNTTQATEAQILTACSQASIEIRDSAISSARTSYNNSMAIALDARKEAEKKAVALTDAGAKKDAIKVAVEEYKRGVTQAQEGLTKARKEAWAAFEVNTKACRETNKDKREAVKDAVDAAKAELKQESKTELRTMQAEVKAEQKAVIEEHKSIREVLKDSLETIKSFFMLKGSADAEVKANAN